MSSGSAAGRRPADHAGAAPLLAEGRRSFPARLVLVGAIALCLSVLFVWQVSGLAGRVSLQELRATSEERLNLYASSLEAATDRLRHLPATLAHHPAIARLLRDGEGLETVHDYLAVVNEASGSAELFIMDTTGLTVAASNWREPTSFVGENYAFRPYFQDALAGRAGQFFAIGATTGRPGLFFSRPVRAGGDIVGVAVAKVDLDPLEADWQAGGEGVVVADRNGVIVLSSDPSWKYRTLREIPAAELERIRADRQYRGRELAKLPFTSNDGRFADDVLLDEVHVLVLARSVDKWVLYYLPEFGGVRLVQLIAAASAIGLLALSFFGFLYVRERQRKKASERAAAEAHRVREINRRLADEVEDRRRAEAELRQTQGELVQAGKLAALGQMSAAIAHEVNQPISAIRNFAASGRVLSERGESSTAAGNFKEIESLTSRIAAITGQLKAYARKTEGRIETVDLQSCVANAVAIVEPQCRLEGVRLETRYSGEKLFVSGEAVKIEQVLINLLRNGIDAMRGVDGQRCLSVVLRKDGGDAVLEVADTGIGIDPGSAEHLFDPFFTTKPVGEGLGLGLAISHSLVDETGGQLQARNRNDGGAVFQARLPLQQKLPDAAE